MFWRMVTIFHHTPVNTIVIKQFDGPAGKRQKRQNSPVKILHYHIR